MSDKVTVIVNGMPYEMPNGMNLVDACRVYVGEEIPIFCYHPKMDPVGMCRMCLVDIGFEQRDRASGDLLLNPDGTPQVRWGPKLDTACTNTVRPGLHLRTTTPAVQEARENVLEFLLSSHPLDCPVCDKGGECPLQNLTMRHGPGVSRMYFTDKLHLAKHYPLGDLIFLDRERCIQCARCIRFQDEVVGDAVLAFHERGRSLQIITNAEPPFDTYFSGNTTDICPVGALTTADFRFGARIWELENIPSISPHGPVGENIVASTRLDRDSGGVKMIKRILPRQNDDVNEIWISDKTRFGHHFSLSPDRLKTPLLRKRGGELAAADWDDAIKATTRPIKEAGNNVGFIAGPMLTNEDLFTLRELASHLVSRKLGLWPPNLGDASPVEEAGIASGSRLTALGKGDAILVIASDLEEEAPLWFLQAKQAADRGATLIVANARDSKLDRYASQQIRYGLGEAADVLLGFAATARSADLLDSDLIGSRVSGFEEWAESVKGTRQPHKDAGEALAKANNLVIFVGDDALTPDQHSALLQAAANFLIATGHVGKPNNGLVPVWPGANTQGALDLGFSAEATRAMLGNAPDVLIVVGANAAYDPAYARLLDEAKFVIHLTLFRDTTSDKADVVLPVQSFAERQGSFTNAMRRVQRFYELHGPLGESLPAWQVVSLIAQKIHGEKPRRSAALVMKALAEEVKAYRGADYAALAQVAPQELPIGASPGFYGGAAAAPTGGTGVQLPGKAEGRGKLHLKAVELPAGGGAGEGQLLIVPVRRLYDRQPEFFASKLMHGRIPAPFISLNYADAVKLGIHDGDTVGVAVGGSTVTCKAVVNGYAPEGAAFLPLHLSSDSMPYTVTAGTVAVIEQAAQPVAAVAE